MPNNPEPAKPPHSPQPIKDVWSDAKSIEQLWGERRTRMAEHRRQFETLWDSGMRRFFQGILQGEQGETSKLYNSLYEQYDISMFSREGLRFTDLKYPLLHAIVMRAMAAEIPNKPKAKWIAIGSNDPAKPLAFKHLFNQVLYEMSADEEDFEIFLEKRICGSSAVFVVTESYEVTVSEPEDKGSEADETDEKDENGEGKESGEVQTDDNFRYEEKTKKIREVMYKKVDLRHVYLDEHCKKTNLKDCGYAQVDEFLSEEEFDQQYPNLDRDLRAKIVAELEQSSNSNPFIRSDQAKYIRVTHCFDRIKDRYHKLANGFLVNKVKQPIPRTAGRRGKDIPIALAIQYKIPGAPYGYGDAHITNTFNSIKNLVRLMLLEITQKQAKPTIAVDPMSPFDEQGFEWGQDFMRVAPGDLKEFSINANLDVLYKLDETTNNDVILTTGTNINDTANIDAGETARKTVIRKESQNALIELTLTYMTDSFFKRLYTLLKDDIRLHYKAMIKNGEEVKVRTEDIKLIPLEDGGLREDKVEGYRYFDLEEGHFDFDMDLVLEMGNIASSKELDKALGFEGIDKTPMAQAGFDPMGLARYIQELSGMPTSVLAQGGNDIESKTPEQLATEGLDPQLLPKAQQMKQMGPQALPQSPNPAQNAPMAQPMAPQPQGAPIAQ